MGHSRQRVGEIEQLDEDGSTLVVRHWPRSFIDWMHPAIAHSSIVPRRPPARSVFADEGVTRVDWLLSGTRRGC